MITFNAYDTPYFYIAYCSDLFKHVLCHTFGICVSTNLYTLFSYLDKKVLRLCPWISNQNKREERWKTVYHVRENLEMRGGART